MSERFYYFAYASNMLRSRMLISDQNAVCEPIGIGQLKDYRLTFDGYDETTWMGGKATIVTSPGDSVWGMIWQLENSYKPSIDKQDGVDRGLYKATQMDIVRPTNEIINCRVLQQVPPVTKVTDTRPSPHYKKVIVAGAKAVELPQDYISKLEDIEDNGYTGEVAIMKDIIL